MRLMRSLLFAPANRHDLLKKFTSYPADAVAIDLEDGTPENEKAGARERLPDVAAYLRELGLKAMLFVRTNGPRSDHIKADIAVVLRASVDGIIIPKLESAADLQMFEASISIIGIIETARGVASVEMLVDQQRRRLSALAFGAEDFITDVGGRRTREGIEVLYARSRVVLAARLGGLQALDQVFTSIRDDDGFRRDAEAGRQLGYSGKMCITPRQVEMANHVFWKAESPPREELIFTRVIAPPLRQTRPNCRFNQMKFDWTAETKPGPDRAAERRQTVATASGGKVSFVTKPRRGERVLAESVAPSALLLA